MVFYGLSFAAGWWLDRGREGLPIVARRWLPNLILGMCGLAAARLAAASGFPGDGSSVVRLGGYALYSLGSAFTCFGILSIFLTYLDRPSEAGRYLADTASWVYLVHQPLVLPTPLVRLFGPASRRVVARPDVGEER